MKDFFISYNHKDTAWAEWIAWHLEEAGYSTIIQAWDFEAGQNFVAEMHKAASGAQRTVAVLSPDYLKSQFTAPEWMAAFARDPTGEKGLLVPVRVRECDLRGLLPQIIYIDLVGQSEDAAATKLLAQIQPGRKKPTTKPSFPAATSSSPPPFPGSSSSRSRPRPTLPRKEGYLFLNVPPMPTNFVGRDELLAEMIARLTSGTDTSLSAKGQAGIGKTTMAVAIAHAPEIVEHFEDGVLWAGLGLAPDVMGILATWGDALGVDVTGYVEPERRAQAIRNAIGMRRSLVVIDDAWHREAAQVLRCGGPNCCHLLTTRDDGIARAFAGAQGTKQVQVLEEEYAFKLLKQLAPEACEADPDAARKLADAVGGLPLALELLGAYLAEPERSLFPELSVAAFTELADPQRRLELAQRRLGTHENRVVTLQETISLSLEGLSEQAISAFYALGAFAPKPETFDREAAVAIAEADATTLALLIRRNLLEQDEGKIAIHQTIADVARQNLPAGVQERHAGHYLSRAEAAGQDWRAIEEIYGQIKWAYSKVSEQEWVFRFIWAMGSYHRLRGLWKEMLGWIQRGIEVAEQQQSNKTLATLLNNAGYLYDSLGDRTRALEYYERALPIRQEVGDRTGEAATLNNIGVVYNGLGQREKALEYHERALPIRQEVGDRTGEATTLNNIGMVYDGLGQRVKALEYYERALPILQEIGNRAGEAATLNNIGIVYDRLGQREKALEYYERALPIQQEIGDRAGEAATLNNIGTVYDGLGQREKALQYYERVLPIVQEIGNRAGEAATLNNIGTVYDGLGQREKALEYYERALPIQQEIGNRAGEAATLNNIGMVYDGLGQREKALEYYERALPIQQEIGNRAGEATTLNNIGLVYHELGQREKGLEYYERALPIRQEVGDRAGEAVTRFNIAMILRKQGRLETAIAELRRVVELDELVQYPDLEQDRAVLTEVEEEWRQQQNPGTT